MRVTFLTQTLVMTIYGPTCHLEVPCVSLVAFSVWYPGFFFQFLTQKRLVQCSPPCSSLLTAAPSPARGAAVPVPVAGCPPPTWTCLFAG